MKLTFLGTGSAFTTGDGNYHSNMLLQSPSGNNLLIDCGGDARHSLKERKWDFRDIQAVYISHLHADHVGGLEWLAFTSKFEKKPPQKPFLYIKKELAEEIWNHTLKGGLSSIVEKEASLSFFFNVHPVDTEFEWEKIKFQLVKTIHCISNYHIMPSHGLFFEINKTHILITTDTKFTPNELNPFYEKADLIFHDCETAKKESGCHSHYEQLKTLSPEIKAKMWLYHYQPGSLPAAQKDGFQGFVKKGQTFEFR